jgi:hypothetical protein
VANKDPGKDLLDRVPPCPPVVTMSTGGAAHLLCWEMHELDGSWHAWISWTQPTAAPARHRHHVVAVRAESVKPVDPPWAYENVPRRVLGSDGRLRPWTSQVPVPR